jgi:hypothetical protein
MIFITLLNICLVLSGSSISSRKKHDKKWDCGKTTFDGETTNVHLLKDPGSYQLCIVQYDDRDFDDLPNGYKKLVQRNKDACEKMDSCQHFFDQTNYDLPVYWRKVQSVWNLMREDRNGFYGNVCETVLWLDTDAAVLNFNVELEKEKLMAVSGDDPESGTSSFCAGVWLVRNNADGRQLMECWASTYNGERWEKKEDGKWKYHSGDWPHVWGSIDYEQGSFADRIFAKDKSKFQIFDGKDFQNPYDDCHGICKHFNSHKAKKRVESFEQKGCVSSIFLR